MRDRQLARDADGYWWIAFLMRSFTDMIPIPWSSSQLRTSGGAPDIGDSENSTLTPRSNGPRDPAWLSCRLARGSLNANVVGAWKRPLSLLLRHQDRGALFLPPRAFGALEPRVAQRFQIRLDAADAVEMVAVEEVSPRLQ